MKKYFRALMMSFTMFCVLPCPFHNWDDEARPLMTLFLPAVGAFIGGLWTLAAYCCLWLGLPPLVRGALLCAFPFLITGGMHFDGFLDTVDAVRSWKSLEERRKILKDPHVGSFAVMFGALLILVQFAFFASYGDGAELFSLMIISVVSRTVASICVSVFKPMETSEYSGIYRKGIKKSHIVILAFLLVLAGFLGFVFLGKYGFVSAAVIAGYMLLLFRAFHYLKGMSGDISGYAMTFAELCGIGVFALI